MSGSEREEDVLPSEEPIGHVLSGGRIFDLLAKISAPVIALPGRTLHRVVIHGSGINLPVEQDDPIIGFYITYFVAARHVREAEAKAFTAVRNRWETFYSEATGELQLEVHEIEALDTRFRSRSRLGFAVYGADA